MALTFELSALGQAAVAARYWRSKGRHLLTVIVKGTFALHHDALMTVSAPLPICPRDRHFDNDRGASVARASDMALHLPKAEVTVVGTAYAARGQRTKSTAARLSLQTERSTLIDKQLEVVGDRRAQPGTAPPEAVAFDRMPLRYERAFGGSRHPDNPVGTGADAGPDGRISYPNVFLREGKGVAPAGFGPIASLWQARSALRGNLSADAADASSDIDVPSDFNDQYFQAAPLDQRVNELWGGELLTLVNMHAELPVLRSFLPRMRGAALVQAANGGRVPVPLRIDTVHVEPDLMRAEIVYRGALALTADQLTHLVVLGALETPPQPFVFPEVAATRSKAPAPASLHASTMILETPSAHPMAGTLILEDPNLPPKLVSISKNALLEAASRRPGVPPAPPPPKQAAPPSARAASMPRPAITEPYPQKVSGTMGTMVIEPPPGADLPFAKGKRKRSGEMPAVIVAKAATPWSESGAMAPVKPATEGKFSSTLVQEAPPSLPLPPPPAPPPPSANEQAEVLKTPEFAPPAAPRDPSKGPWREEASAPDAAPTAPAKQVVPQRTNVKGALYKPKR